MKINILNILKFCDTFIYLVKAFEFLIVSLFFAFDMHLGSCTNSEKKVQSLNHVRLKVIEIREYF